MHLFFFEIPSKALKQPQPIKKEPEESDSRDDLNMTAAAEWSERITDSVIMAPLNIQVVNYKQEGRQRGQIENPSENQRESYFPRLVYFDAKSSLIDIHLALFSHIKFIFTRVLELKEDYFAKTGGIPTKRGDKDTNSFLEDMLFQSKMQKSILLNLSLEKWNSMSLTEQYEFVFSSAASGSKNPSLQASNPRYNPQFSDPSRKKPQELPYFVRVVSRKTQPNEGSLYEDSEESKFNGGDKDDAQVAANVSTGGVVPKCIFCMRKQCEGCPLPFNDKITLRQFLERSKVPLEPRAYLKEDDDFNYKALAAKIKAFKKQMEEL